MSGIRRFNDPDDWTTRKITVLVSSELDQQLRVLAARLGVGVGPMIREWLMEKLQENNETKDAPPDDQTTDILICARDFLERGWCCYAVARDASGNAVNETDSTAVQWSLTGALLAAGVEPGKGFSTHPACRHLYEAIKGRSDVQPELGLTFTRFNNAQKGVEPILTAIDRAIAMEDADG